MNTPPVEQGEYWRAYFAAMDRNSSLGMAVWSGVFNDSEIGEIVTRPGESIEAATQRHYRKLEAMLEALEEVEASNAAFQSVARSIRQLLKL